MPQMAPINWLILFSFFLMIMFIMVSIMYFNFLKKKINNKIIKNMIKNYNKFI